MVILHFHFISKKTHSALFYKAKQPLNKKQQQNRPKKNERAKKKSNCYFLKKEFLYESPE